MMGAFAPSASASASSSSASVPASAPSAATTSSHSRCRRRSSFCSRPWVDAQLFPAAAVAAAAAGDPASAFSRIERSNPGRGSFANCRPAATFATSAAAATAAVPPASASFDTTLSAASCTTTTTTTTTTTKRRHPRLPPSSIGLQILPTATAAVASSSPTSSYLSSSSSSSPTSYCAVSAASSLPTSPLDFVVAPTSVPKTAAHTAEKTRGGTSIRACKRKNPPMTATMAVSPPSNKRPAGGPEVDDDDYNTNANNNGNGNGSGNDTGTNNAQEPAPKVKLPRLERPVDDFSTVVKNRLSTYTRTGQACDRCKVRKIRCDALPEGCSHCTTQKLKCYVTNRVTGRTERRGYLQELERNQNGMASRIRDLEKLLADTGIEVQEYDPEDDDPDQLPPGVSLDDQGGVVQDPNATDSWTQVGSTWVKNYQPQRRGFGSSLPRSMLRSRPEDSYLGIEGDSAATSSIRGTRLSILGMWLDFGFDAPDMDETQALPIDRKTAQPLYDRSPRAFWQSAMGINPPLEVELPDREQCCTYITWYFYTISAFLPILHRPSIMKIVDRVYDEPDFKPTTPQLVVLHMIMAIMNLNYGTRNWDVIEQKDQYNADSDKHYHFAVSKLYELNCSHDIEAVQALALMAVHTRSFPKPGTAAIATNLALQRALELNLHREPHKSGQGTNLGRELRKRVWWAIMCVYMGVAGRRGRPMPITAEEFDVGFPEPIADELLSEDGVDTTTNAPCAFLPGMAAYKITLLFIQMYSSLYCVRRDPHNYVYIIETMEARIQAWQEELPDHLTLGHPEASDANAMPALWVRIFYLEFRLCLRHPSVAMTTDKKLMDENSRISDQIAQELLRVQLEVQKFKCLDTTWYQLSVNAAAIFTTLAHHWERRQETTEATMKHLQEVMAGWMSILNETSGLLGLGSTSLSTEIGSIINHTLASIAQDMPQGESKAAVTAPPLNIKQETEQPRPTPASYPTSQSLPIPAEGPNQAQVVVAKEFYQQPPSINPQPATYSDMAFADQPHPNMGSSSFEQGATVFYNNAAPATAAPMAANPMPHDITSQPNPLMAFASQATQQVAIHPAGPADDMLWQQGRNAAWHDWTTAFAGSQGRFGANTLVNPGAGGVQDAAGARPGTIEMVPSHPSHDMNMHQGVQWPLMLFDQVDNNGA